MGINSLEIELSVDRTRGYRKRGGKGHVVKKAANQRRGGASSSSGRKERRHAGNLWPLFGRHVGRHHRASMMDFPLPVRYWMLDS